MEEDIEVIKLTVEEIVKMDDKALLGWLDKEGLSLTGFLRVVRELLHRLYVRGR